MSSSFKSFLCSLLSLTFQRRKIEFVFELEMVSELGRIESLERTDKTRAFLRLIHHQVGVVVVAVVTDVETVDVDDVDAEADDVDIVANDLKVSGKVCTQSNVYLLDILHSQQL